jgi:cytochrome oxidase assembly protein ShyY1
VEHEFAPIRVRGTFEHDEEQLLTPRFKDGEAGAHVITPFQLADREYE